MAGSGEIKAGSAYVELFVKGNIGKELDKVAKQLKNLGDSIANIGKKMGAIGVSITAPLLIAAERFASMGDQINKASQRTGIAVETLTELKYAAEQSGASFEDLESGIRKMQKAIFEAAGGSKEAKEALAGIGLTVDDLKGKSPDEQFATIAEALNHVSDASARTAEAMEIFGKGGAALLPLIANGADGLKKLRDRARELGLTFSAEDAEAATVFGDTLDDLWKQVKAVTFQVGAAIAQALQPFATAATKVLAGVIEWTRQNRTLVIAVLGVGVALATAGAALVAFGIGVKAVGIAISGITATFSAVSTAVGLLSNPIVLIGVGLVALAGYFLYATKTGGAALAWLGAKFATLKATAMEALGGIADALAAGDIGLAAQILWTGLKLLWVQGTQELQNKWGQFKAGFVQTAAAAFYGALEIWTNVKASLMSAWENLTTFLGNLWDGFVGTFADAWDNAVNSVAKGINYIKGLWDDSFDSKAANKTLDDKVASQQAARRKKEMDDNTTREADRKKSLQGIEAQRGASVKDINGREMGISAAADENARKDASDLQKQKTDLEKQLQDLRSKAKSERDASGGGLVPSSKLSDLDDVINNRQAVSAKSGGIFNVAALQSLQGGGVQDRIAKAAEETAKNTRNIKASTYGS